jgi:hypothetical protein
MDAADKTVNKTANKIVIKVVEVAKWLAQHPDTVFRYRRAAQRLCGLVLIVCGYQFGHMQFDLIRHGVRTEGTIVDYTYQHFRGGKGNAALVPVVQFRIGHKIFRFKDWIGTNAASDLNTRVPILYKTSDPSVAMIDRAVMNWIPWAPIFVAGAFLVWGSLFGKRPDFGPALTDEQLEQLNTFPGHRHGTVKTPSPSSEIEERWPNGKPIE